MDGISVKPLTVSFHEGRFLNKLNGENRLAFWFELNDQERKLAGNSQGPINAQALNRYSYVQNNPLKYTDPTGHHTGHEIPEECQCGGGRPGGGSRGRGRVQNVRVVQGSYRSLDKANSQLDAKGIDVARIAKDYLRHLTAAERGQVTIAVARVNINGVMREVVTINGSANSTIVSKIEAAAKARGSVFSQAKGTDHAETHLYNTYKGNGLDTIGVSHYAGPCPNCANYLSQQGFHNVYWDSTFVP